MSDLAMNEIAANPRDSAAPPQRDGALSHHDAHQSLDARRDRRLGSSPSCSPCRSSPAAPDPGPVLRPDHAVPGAILEPARRLCRAGLGRPAGLRRARRLSAVRARHPVRPRSDVPIVLSGFVTALGRAAHRLRRVPPARPLFRDRHLGGGRSVPAAAGAVQVARRRHRHLAAARRHQRFLRRHCRSPSCSACAPPPRATSSPTGWR